MNLVLFAFYQQTGAEPENSKIAYSFQTKFTRLISATRSGDKMMKITEVDLYTLCMPQNIIYFMCIIMSHISFKEI